MIRIAISIAFAAALAAPSFAGEQRPLTPPRLKELVTVTADIVRIGDLVDNAGAVAGIAVFRAPDLGQTGAVLIARVTDALQPHDLANLDTGGLSEVVVTRLSRAVSAKDIQERIARAFSGHQGLGEPGSLAVTFDREMRPIQVEANATAEFAVSRMYFDPRTGRYDITLELPGSEAARRLSLRFTGTVTDMVETATLVRTVGRGEALRASDVLVERRPKSEVAGEALTAEQTIGLSAKRPLRAGQVLRLNDLMKSDVVQRNDAVTIIFEVPGILLTVRGKALDPGAVGDVISVLNVQSNRTVQATVSGPGRVTIGSTMPVAASNTIAVSENTSALRRQ